MAKRRLSFDILSTPITCFLGTFCKVCKEKEAIARGLCLKHYNRWQHKRNNPLRIRSNRLKERVAYCKQQPRTGQCQNCHRKVGEGISRTFIWIVDPDAFDASRPQAGTEELCFRCLKELHPDVQDAMEA